MGKRVFRLPLVMGARLMVGRKLLGQPETYIERRQLVAKG